MVETLLTSICSRNETPREPFQEARLRPRRPFSADSIYYASPDVEQMFAQGQPCHRSKQIARSGEYNDVRGNTEKGQLRFDNGAANSIAGSPLDTLLYASILVRSLFISSFFLPMRCKMFRSGRMYALSLSIYVTSLIVTCNSKRFITLPVPVSWPHKVSSRYCKFLKNCFVLFSPF